MSRFIYLIFIIFWANSANAILNEDLYKSCKIYTDLGFAADNKIGALCLTYFHAIADTGYMICTLSEEFKASESREGGLYILKKAMGVGSSRSTMDAMVQHYVNAMKNNPQSWDQIAAFDVAQSIKEFSPCN